MTEPRPRFRSRVARRLSEDAPSDLAPPSPARAGTSMVDCAIYVEGERVASPERLEDAAATLARHPGGMLWIGLYRPGEAEIARVGEDFGLHQLAQEDALFAHQRPKLERYGDTLFTVLRAAWYIDATEQVEIGEVHVYTTPDVVVTVRHAETPDIGRIRRGLERDEPHWLAHGPEAVLYAILDAVVDGYEPVIEGLQNDVVEIEQQIFAGEGEVSQRVYQLNQEVIELYHASEPMAGLLRALRDGFERHGVDVELHRHLRDVADHVDRAGEKITAMRANLRDILTVNATLVAQRQNDEMARQSEITIAQNEQMKKISAWAAILYGPTLIGAIYGMNFRIMPELDWDLGYLWALGLMAAMSVTFYIVFKRKDWL